jgi:hypothetical protein
MRERSEGDNGMNRTKQRIKGESDEKLKQNSEDTKPVHVLKSHSQMTGHPEILNMCLLLWSHLCVGMQSFMF